LRTKHVWHTLFDYILFCSITLLAQGAIGWWALLVGPPIMTLLNVICIMHNTETKR
jgi:hypothetical protein